MCTHNSIEVSAATMVGPPGLRARGGWLGSGEAIENRI